MSDIQAFWISPSGKAIEVERFHISTIMDDPKKFNTTEAELKKTYKKHKEQYSPFIEGFAREEIMIDMMKKGWIRTRYVRKTNTWTIQVAKLNKRIKDYIFDWVANMVQKRKMGKRAGIMILPILPGQQQVSGDAGDVINFKLFEEYKIAKPKGKFLIEFCTLEQFEPSLIDFTGSIRL
jgi:hypothetical protein